MYNVIAPTFLECAWFAGSCAFGICVAAMAIVRIRIRQLKFDAQQRKKERTAERERIARELHDTLIQSTEALVLAVQVAAARVALDDPSRTMLERVLQQADELIGEGRDWIQNLRMPAHGSADLLLSLRAIGEELVGSSPVNFRASVEGETRNLRPTVSHEAYAICREAIVNAFRHANASNIEVLIFFRSNELLIRIRDDGQGINADALDTWRQHGRWGLRGMHERAQIIGARFNIVSKRGKGTAVALAVRARRAYVRPIERFHWMSHWRLPSSQREVDGP